MQNQARGRTWSARPEYNAEFCMFGSEETGQADDFAVISQVMWAAAPPA